MLSIGCKTILDQLVEIASFILGLSFPKLAALGEDKGNSFRFNGRG